MPCAIDSMVKAMSNKKVGYKVKAERNKGRIKELKRISRLSKHLFIPEFKIQEVHRFRIHCCVLLALFTHLLIANGIVQATLGGWLIALYVLGTTTWLLCEKAEREGHLEKIHALIEAYSAKDVEAKMRILKLSGEPKVIQPDDFTDWLNIEMMSLMH